MRGGLSAPFLRQPSPHPTVGCSLVRHRADSQERERKPRQRRHLSLSATVTVFAFAELIDALSRAARCLPLK
jgi:hypothetical protein